MAAVAQPFRVAAELADGLDIGRKPGEAMGCALLLVEQALNEVTVGADALAYSGGRVAQHGFRNQCRLARQHREREPRAPPITRIRHWASPDCALHKPRKRQGGCEYSARFYPAFCYILNHLAVSSSLRAGASKQACGLRPDRFSFAAAKRIPCPCRN